ncbi:predicted protein [Naegleria gruberi]|uniref:Predicted protein n=1 Tax=Naegleria gruberi TaxID=5762 RepID=D2W361_NAEGR|nr:uncharacterized protein NAEGRDRAFT_75832 [Naegleria gruberi]EFC36561.1 predicted protein [Naegleria gruberi]|eukprot:XP_002669305.1 predicted protein [Naegleria gruberi strain NEG-M]
MIEKLNQLFNSLMSSQQKMSELSLFGKLSSSSSLTQILIFIISIITGGFRYYQTINNNRKSITFNSIPSLQSSNNNNNNNLSSSSITSSNVNNQQQQQIRKVLTSPYFGERPHYFLPPSDVEQYRKTISNNSNNSNNSNSNNNNNNIKKQIEHYYIPYPNDPPHTFPSIKARNLFTKSPKKLSQIYIERIDPINRSNLRTGAKLKVPLQQLEERFRTVYSNANENGLEITINSKSDKPFEKLGHFKNDHVYDFHSTDGLLSPPLYK